VRAAASLIAVLFEGGSMPAKTRFASLKLSYLDELPLLPCRLIAGSGVDPLLPNCPNQTWASHLLTDLLRAGVAPSAAVTGRPATSLASGLGTVGLCAALLAGAGMWRRKLLQHAAEQTVTPAEKSEVATLHGSHHTQVPVRPPTVPGGLASFAARSKKERLAAMLSAAIQDGSRGVEMLPLRGAPRTLVHQLTSNRTMSAASSRQQGHPADSQPLLPVGGPGSTGSSGSRSGGTSAGSTGEWGWRLQTDSLCLAPGQLQVRSAGVLAFWADAFTFALCYCMLWMAGSTAVCQ
jgi:hypothetical protein